MRGRAFARCRNTLAELPNEAMLLHRRREQRWAILFSHPQDFLEDSLAMDRWIEVLSRSFVEGVRAYLIVRWMPNGSGRRSDRRSRRR